MKRNFVLCIIIMLLFTGCGGRQSEASYIGADQARQLALNACGVTEAETESVSTNLVSHNGQECYQVDVTVPGQNYQYKINAFSGVIVAENITGVEESGLENNGNAGQASSGQTAQSGQGQTVQPGEGQSEQSGAGQPLQTDGPGYHSEDHTGNQHASASSAGSSAGAAKEMITLEEAKEKALAHAQLVADQVVFVEDKLDYEDGRSVYELEFYSEDHREFDYEIDAYSGEIVSFDYDAEHYTLPQAADGSVTADEAKELALAKVPGAAVGDIVEFKTDRDDGRTEYEGKIIYDGMEYEFEIDGSSGQILSWEEEPFIRR